ncbi:MAG: dihydroorotase family protein [Thermoplasmata archaeon]|jgi:dihydropyrimidinase
MSELVLKNARLVFPHRGVVEGEIGVSGGRIDAVGKDLERADHTVDVHGALVGPGIVDPHTHIGIYRPADADARTESECAVRGGVTTMVTYWRVGEPYTDGPVAYAKGFDAFQARLAGRMSTDYAVNLGMLTREHLEEVPTLVRKAGVTTLKYFVHYEGRVDIGRDLDAGYFYRLAKTVAGLSTEVPAVRLSVHCEDPAIVREATDEEKRKGGSDLEAYRRSRPECAEAVAIARLGEVALATGAPVYLPHVSSALGYRRAAEFVGQGADLIIETSLHYLTLTCDAPAQVLAKVNPAIRRAEDVEALWNALAHGGISCVGSDHASNARAEKTELWSAKPAFPGTGLLLPLLFEEGVVRRRLITPEKLWGILSENSARAHGLYPRKGSLAPGADADLVVFSKHEEPRRVSAESVHSAADYSPYEGRELHYGATATYVRGTLVVDESGLHAPGSGAYLHRPLTAG